MPKKNPKHQAQIQRLQQFTRKGKSIHNWRKIGTGILICVITVVIITIGLTYYAPSNYRTVMDGDQVFIYYELRLGDGSLEDYSKDASGNKNLDGTSFTIARGQLIDGFYEQVIGMKEGETKSFKIEACGSPPCENYKGYASGNLAWKELNFYVKIVKFVE